MMAEAQGMFDNVTMREIRGTISRLESLTRQLERTQNQQAAQIAKLAAQVTSVAQMGLTMQFWGNRLSRALEPDTFSPLGIAIPILGSVTMGMGRGIDAAAQTQKLGEYIKSGNIQFGTEADRQRYAVEQALRLTVGFFGI